MATSKVIYKGELRTECTHLNSKEIVVTDAPLDNNGLGRKFSPTDLVATALGSCMMTIMGIKARDKAWEINGSTVEVTKIMEVNPRRIAQIDLKISMHIELEDKDKNLLKRAAMTCPVFNSIHPDIEVVIEWEWR